VLASPSLRTEPYLSDSTAQAPLLTCEAVEKRYGEFRPALMSLDLAIGRGEFVLVQGPAGCGKSVLLRLLAGLETPSAGAIKIAGEDLARMRPRALTQLRRSMGILPPGYSLLRGRSIVENVALAAWVAGSTLEEGLRRARAALELVGLDVQRYGAARCDALASGQQQCAALARALVNRPALLLLDDLLTPLDEATGARVIGVLDQFSAAGVTVVVAMRAGAALSTLSAPWPARTRTLRLLDGKVAQ
jgi:ABC-type ATPase involved in cell division